MTTTTPTTTDDGVKRGLLALLAMTGVAGGVLLVLGAVEKKSSTALARSSNPVKVKLGKFSSGDPEDRQAPVFYGDLVVGAVVRMTAAENIAKRGGNSHWKHTVIGYSIELFGPGDPPAVEVKTRGEVLAYIKSVDLTGVGRVPTAYELGLK
jgi:hypothetical protein